MSRLVDWELAHSIAERIAGDGDAEPKAEGPALDEVEAGAREAVLFYTGLELEESPPAAEWVSRREWIEINLAGLRASLELVEERFGGMLALPGPARGVMEAVVSKLTATEIGGLVGFASTKVLGQYEYPLLGGERDPRLLFVGENIDAAHLALDADAETLLRWIALHECTHSVHFSSAPWLRTHLGANARGLIAEAGPGISAAELVGIGRRAVSEDPRKLIGELRRSDPMTLLASPDARERIAAMQATMAAIEGYAEHVMDAAAPELGEVEALRAAIEERRSSRGVVVRILAWILGLEMKMRQYREGKRFVDEIVATTDIATLNLAWRDAQSLPGSQEMAEPELWLARMPA